MSTFYGRYSSLSGGGGGGSGATASGNATLTNGTVTVSNASIASGSVFSLTTKSVSGIQGALSVGTVVVGASFVINSTSAGDNSTVSWSFI